jgi:hypothetical protein
MTPNDAPAVILGLVPRIYDAWKTMTVPIGLTAADPRDKPEDDSPLIPNGEAVDLLALQLRARFFSGGRILETGKAHVVDLADLFRR